MPASPPQSTPITQRELARRAGVSQACVSLALKGSTRIPAATRARIQALASAAAYLPDPALSSLARRRWHTPVPTTIAYLGRPAPPPGALTDARDRYHEAVVARCAEPGLRVQHLARTRGGDAELQRTLERTRVAGVLVGQSTLEDRPRSLAWERLRAVHCGLIVPPGSGDIVCPDLSAAVPDACRRMGALGYRRIAAVLFADPRAYSEQLLAGALLALERVVADRARLRVWIGSRRDAALARRWLRAAAPDAVLGYDQAFADQLRRAGEARPYAALVTLPDRPDIAGMELPFAAIASAAVDLLADRLRGPPGPPPQRRLHLIEMAWRGGASLG